MISIDKVLYEFESNRTKAVKIKEYFCMSADEYGKVTNDMFAMIESDNILCNCIYINAKDLCHFKTIKGFEPIGQMSDIKRGFIGILWTANVVWCEDMSLGDVVYAATEYGKFNRMIKVRFS